jgi:hypothetical protein
MSQGSAAARLGQAIDGVDRVIRDLRLGVFDPPDGYPDQTIKSHAANGPCTVS